MDAAEDWGIPPWEITEDGNRVLWYERYKLLHQMRAKASKKTK